MTGKAIICDLDGTYFNIESRRKFLDLEKPDWKAFSDVKNMEFDKVNEWCRNLVRFYLLGDYHVLFFSGREAREGVFEYTRNALLESLDITRTMFYSRTSVYLRPEGNYCSDVDLKRWLYLKHKAGYSIEVCIDDRQSIVDLWRSEGLVCLQCAEGDF